MPNIILNVIPLFILKSKTYSKSSNKDNFICHLNIEISFRAIPTDVLRLKNFGFLRKRVKGCIYSVISKYNLDLVITNIIDCTKKVSKIIKYYVVIKEYRT